MADAWLRAGRIRVSAHEFRIVRDFLERDGWTVEELPGWSVRLRSGGVLSAEMTREAAALVALRRLVAPGEWRQSALRTGAAPLLRLHRDAYVEAGTVRGRATLALPRDARA